MTAPTMSTAPPAPSSRTPGPGPAAPDASPRVVGSTPAPHRTVALSPRRITVLVATWLVVTLLGTAAVAYGLGPLVQQREQRLLLSAYRTDVRQAAFEAQGLPGVSVPTEAAGAGAPVAIMEIGRLKLQQVVSEGVGADQTRRGPGHVPGTAGPGQPGNSAVVGRRGSFGGPFRELDRMQRGDEILITTTQGQTVYRVTSVRTAKLASAPSPRSSSTTTTIAEPTARAGAVGKVTTKAPAASKLRPDTVFGPANDDRLTLVTSGSSWPGQASKATVVVARMDGQPFAPTPQGGRTSRDDGRRGDPGAWPAVALAALAYLVVGAAAVIGYQRTRLRSAYLLSAPPLVACTVLLAEALSRLLPAWT